MGRRIPSEAVGDAAEMLELLVEKPMVGSESGEEDEIGSAFHMW